ncbi:sensor histidine kinase [Streptomyces sp. NPDC101152]|uniref:sensor histidine kinase n=1 Tax=Streptomyces sp. NPDC101152 TaxID=3366116 RepID=UPI00382B8240
MSRLIRVTEKGIQRLLGGRVLDALRTLRDDLWTVRPHPLPPMVRPRRLRRLPHVVLCVTAWGITVGGLAQLTDNGSQGFGAAFAIALTQGGSVVVALRRPILGWWLSTGATLVGAIQLHSRLGGPPGSEFTWPWTTAGILAQMLVLLLLALRVPTRVASEALGVTVVVTYLLESVWGSQVHHPTGVLALALFTIVVVLGIAIRGRREARVELGRQATLTAEERARRTLLEERNRIARELHDVVAHHMSVISIQAQVAPHLVADPSQELRENLEGIRQNALEALTELRRVLGVLRSQGPDADATEDGDAEHSPQPTLERLGALVENTRAAGLTVSVRTVGERRSLPSGVQLSAYRIVQEALSNVLRHAPGASARVEVQYIPYGLQVDVVNSRPERPAPASPGAGHGLLGMRERVAMLGGDLSAGPQPDGGYKVSAFIPVNTLAGGLEYGPNGGLVYRDPEKDDTA